MFGSHTPQEKLPLAHAIVPHASVGTIDEAAKFGEVVLLAVRWANVQGYDGSTPLRYCWRIAMS
jgi:predicted dinucleotide-binding enzyme